MSSSQTNNMAGVNNQNIGPSTFRFAEDGEAFQPEPTQAMEIDVTDQIDGGTGDTNDDPHLVFSTTSSSSMPLLVADNDQVATSTNAHAPNGWSSVFGNATSSSSTSQGRNALEHGTSKTKAGNTSASQHTEASADTFMSAAAKKFWANVKNEPTDNQQEKKKRDEKISKEAKELLDMFQAPQGMVRVVIPSGKKFVLHIDVLVEKCDYFRAALTGHFREADTKMLDLPDVSDNTFGFFLKWVYSGSLRPENNPNRCSMHNESTLTLPGLFELWFFADYLRAPALQNHIVTIIVEKFRIFIMWSTEERLKHISESIKMLWKPKARTDLGELAKPLRDLMIDFVGNPRYMPKAKAEKLLKSVPTSFLREYTLGTVGRNSTIVHTTNALEETLEIPEDFGSDDEALFEWELGVHEHLDAAMDGVNSLRLIWEIKPEKYFVNEVKRAEETK